MASIAVDPDDMVDAAQGALDEGEHGIEVLPKLIIGIIKRKAWKKRYSKVLDEYVEFRSFEEFVETAKPRGLGVKLDSLTDLCRRNTKATDAIDQATTGRQGARTDLGNNVPEVGRPEGNTRAKGLRRLRKDRPDLHAKVLSDELSVHAACKKAGWRKDPAPLDVLRRTWKKASKAERLTFLAEIQ